jgi:F-box/leucine-rich repeat protein 10/11
MKRVVSFKAQYRQAPARAATPPSPAWEPLSPTLPLTAPSATHPAGGCHPEPAPGSRHTNGSAIKATAAEDAVRAPLQLGSLAVTYEPPPRAAPLPHPPPYSLPPGSPIDALADVALISQRPSPAYVEPPRRASHAATSPPRIVHPASERAPLHTFARDAAYSFHERPAKRARSEYHTSPPYGQAQSRPATSHIPGWSYNVEQMVASGTRMYQDVRVAAPQQSNGGDKMLSDAELLLFFSNVSAHTAQSPPATTKRWSISQSTPAELPPQQTRQTHEPSSPHPAAAHISSPTHQRKQDALDLNPPPQAQATEEPEAASASQTQTPPEDAASTASQTLVPEAGPAEEPKSKKQQGWPKGKSRGPRSTPSTGKRKRSTPKPKTGSSSSTSAGPDQLQSPQSLAAEQPVPMASNGAYPVQNAVQQPLLSNMQNRRHSFSSTHPQNSNGAVVPAFLRARSVPLGGAPVATTAIDDLRPAKKAAAEQPDLICAACKHSESEIKVGDGEQWIGCDGCKEWYHYACAGFSSEREVRDVNKFYCDPCRPKFGETTSRSTDAKRRYNSNLAQRFASPLEFTPRSIMPVSMKASSRLPTTTPSITTSPLSRMEI